MLVRYVARPILPRSRTNLSLYQLGKAIRYDVFTVQLNPEQCFLALSSTPSDQQSHAANSLTPTTAPLDGAKMEEEPVAAIPGQPTPGTFNGTIKSKISKPVSKRRHHRTKPNN
jgi:hypothetical protein